MSVYSTNSADQPSGAKRTHSASDIQGCFNDVDSEILQHEETLSRTDTENTIFR